VPPSYWSNLVLQRGLALVWILEIPILAFINFLSDATMRSRGGERAGALSTLTLVLTFDRAAARVRRAAARCGQNPPKWLLGYCAIARRGAPPRAGAQCPVPPIFGFLLLILEWEEI
ncbi:hypothetical protein PIB30_089719, partial [Stylosanthes scabra]|nr:hypothetical protein [Stylosanthes scabra]